MTTHDPPTVKHNSAINRFELEQDGLMCKLVYRIRGKKMIFIHANVPPALEGRGLGSLLVRVALDYARANGLKVVPFCPFVRAYIRKHPEYQDLMR